MFNRSIINLREILRRLVDHDMGKRDSHSRENGDEWSSFLTTLLNGRSEVPKT